MNTLQEQYNLITEGKGNKAQFLKNAKFQFPNLFNAFTSYEDATNVLKSKGLISEGIGGVVTKGVEQDWVKIFKNNITEEVKAEEKKTSKEVEDVLAHNFDYKDDKNIDNVYGQSFLNGFYTEMQDPKNEDKTVDQVKEIVRKNLAKDRLYYTKDGMFGIKGLGYTEEAPGLGPTKEVAGKYKSSGMEPVKLREAYAHEQKDWYKTAALKIFQELKEKYTEDELDKALEKYVKENGADLKKIDKAKVIDKLKGYERELVKQKKSESQALKEEIFNLFKKKDKSGEINVKDNPLLTPERAERLADILLLRIANDNTPEGDKKYFIRQYERLRNQMPELNLDDPAQDVDEGATEYIGREGADAIKKDPDYTKLSGEVQQDIQTNLKTNKRTAVA